MTKILFISKLNIPRYPQYSEFDADSEYVYLVEQPFGPKTCLKGVRAS